MAFPREQRSRGHQQLGRRFANALIAIEILSKNSQRRDRFHKMADYAKAGIPHYWLVDWDERARLSLSTMPWSAMGASTFRSESRTETATTPP